MTIKALVEPTNLFQTIMAGLPYDRPICDQQLCRGHCSAAFCRYRSSSWNYQGITNSSDARLEELAIAIEQRDMILSERQVIEEERNLLLDADFFTRVEPDFQPDSADALNEMLPFKVEPKQEPDDRYLLDGIF